MEQSLLTGAMEQGLWALLFVSLYWYQLNESRRLMQEARDRETKLTEFIDGIVKQLETLARQYERISEDVTDIKHDISVYRKGRE